METMQEQIPGYQPVKRRVCYYLPTDVVDDLDDLRRTHRVNLSEFIAAAARDSLKRYGRRKPPPTQPAA